MTKLNCQCCGVRRWCRLISNPALDKPISVCRKCEKDLQFKQRLES